jgi:hypothetical protein
MKKKNRIKNKKIKKKSKIKNKMKEKNVVAVAEAAAMVGRRDLAGRRWCLMHWPTSSAISRSKTCWEASRSSADLGARPLLMQVAGGESV